MAEKFQKGALIVLILLAIMAVVQVYESIRMEKQMLDVIGITDSRTEYLVQEVEALKQKISMLEAR